MREHDIDKHLISNIEIPDAMRESLIQDVNPVSYSLMEIVLV